MVKFNDLNLISIYISNEDFKKLQKLKERYGTSISLYGRKAIHNKLKKDFPKKKIEKEIKEEAIQNEGVN